MGEREWGCTFSGKTCIRRGGVEGFRVSAGKRQFLACVVKSRRALHFQVSFDDTVLTKIITIYEPDPNEWIEHRKRR